MSGLIRSNRLVVSIAGGVGVFTLAMFASALASLQYPSEIVLRAAEKGTPGHLMVEPVRVATNNETTIWENSSPAALANEIEESYFSPDGLRSLAGPASPNPPRKGPGLGGTRLNRLLLWSGFSAAAAVEAFRQSQAAWGASNGKFHIKPDSKRDGLAMTDEASHMLIAYRLSQFIESGYRWSGVEAKRARLWGSAEAWFLTFLVEYPIDAYNPQQGLGVSDLLFNTMGALAAYGHSAAANPRWDIKVSVKPQFFNGSGRVIAYNTKQYDDFIYWVTYRPVPARYVPLLAGLGYSTSHERGGNPTKELRLGVGTTLEEIGAMIGSRTEQFLRPLNFFFFNLAAKITWR